MNARNAIKDMSDEAKRETLARLLRNRVSRAESYPLSDAQLGMWFQQNLEPTSAAYNMPLAFCLHGRIREPQVIVRSALAAVVARHPVLRTVFVGKDDEPRQCVQDDMTVSLEFREMHALLAGDWVAEVPALTREQARHAFDLRKGPLFRFELLQLSQELHILLATFHHIIMDGWSIGVFLKDFALAFIAHARSQPLAYDPLDYSYRQHIDEQKSPVRVARLEAGLDYWQKRLADAPRSLSLPVTFRRTAGVRYRGATFAFDIPVHTSTRLTKLAQSHGATSFMVMLASFYALLARIGGQEDIVLGVSTSNRERKESRAVIGLFSDVLPMRAVATQGNSFSQFLKEVRRTCLDDYEHAGASLTRIIERVNPAREADRNLLFQAGFDFQNTPWPAVLGDHVTLLNGDSGGTKLDLNLNLSKVQDSLSCVFEYDTQLFSESAIQRIARCYQTLLESIAGAPQVALERLQIFDERECGEFLSRVSPCFDAGQFEPTVLAQVGNSARRDPDSIALEEPGRSISYAELETCSRTIAGAILAAGGMPGERIGLLFERSADFALALLGVGRADATYVPLDPRMSAERRDYIVADAGIRIVLATRAMAASWQGDPSIRFLAVDDMAGQRIPDLHLPDPDPDRTAYIIYTSGTTGEPKGVKVSHRSLACFAEAAAARFGTQATDRALQFASISFDTSAEELFPALIRGATVVFPGADMLGSVERFLEGCAERAISILNLPTAFWHEVVDMLQTSRIRVPRSVRLLIIGGEAASPLALSRWLATMGRDVVLLNTYGPTETTVSVTAAELSVLVEPERLLSLPIGRPYPGIRIHVLDPFGCPLPPGLYGEIVIAGPTVAQGYHGAADATAEKFIADPFASVPGSRAYRTGDFGRYLESGDIEFAGRRDDQVKILGFRVELPEIEAALMRCSGVARAVVLLLEAQDATHKRIAAYVVPKNDGDVPTVETLRSSLRRALPAYMLPSHFWILDSLPLTTSGKVDRTALLALSPPDAEGTSDSVSPRTAEEAMLLTIWLNVLKVDRAGINDNFFDLGGHSLLLIRLLSRVRHEFNVDISLAQAFDAPTIFSMAKTISALRDAGEIADLAPIEPLQRTAGDDRQAFRQSFAQQGLWFLHRLEPESSAYNNPSALRIDGPLDCDALQQSIDALVARHEILRTVFDDGDRYPLQIVRANATIPVARIDLGGLSEFERRTELARLIDADARMPFDLKGGPLLRLTVVRCAPDHSVLIFNWHHIITDAWTLSLFIGELARLYRARLDGLVEAEPAPRLQYADYAEWQWTNADNAAMTRQLRYWKQKLDGIPASMGLPFSSRAMTHAAGPCRRVQRVIPGKIATALVKVARSSDATLFIVCLAAFKTLLARYTSRSDIVVGSPISGRSREELENLLGYFINTLVMRTDLSGASRFMQVVERVRQTAVEAYGNQTVPFERVVQEVSLGRSGSGSSLFEVSFVLENREIPANVFAGSRVSSIQRGMQDAKFALSLSMRELEDGLSCEWEYPHALFDEGTVESMATAFERLLEGIAREPDSAMADLPLLDASERKGIVRFGDGADRIVESLCVHQLFERQADLEPRRAAIICDGEVLSYAELDARANRLARVLRNAGVAPDTCVGVCLDRSPDLAIALLAVWKAGGAWVPLDPAQPPARRIDMLADSGAKWLLTRASLREDFDGVPVDVFVVDSEQSKAQLRNQSTIRLERDDVGVAPRHLAYVIFTSGSTGRPKGVMVEHRSVVNLRQGLNALLAETGIALPCPWAWNASFAFDASLQALLQWSNGSTLHILPETLRRDPVSLLDYLRDQRIAVLDATPLQVDMLLACAGSDDALPNLVIGGEAIAPDLWARIDAHCQRHGTRAINVYGPTEATVDATAVVISGRQPTLGKPLPNVRCRVVDRHGQLLPVGAQGELYLAGAGLARGYVNRPELDLEHFVELDLGGRHERMYRTGDQVRWLPCGALEFLGRDDGQVKVRGYRVETGEVEHRLREMPGVANAIVAAFDPGSGVNELAVYLVPEHGVGEETAWLAGLEAALGRLLPEYMIPTSWTRLDAIPLTRSGKLDRAALPSPRRAQLPARNRQVPAGKTEEDLAAIWADLFALDADGIDAQANFFELGGNSLLLMRLMSSIRSGFAVELGLKSVFEARSLREIAAMIDAAVLESVEYPANNEAVEETTW